MPLAIVLAFERRIQRRKRAGVRAHTESGIPAEMGRTVALNPTLPCRHHGPREIPTSPPAVKRTSDPSSIGNTGELHDLNCLVALFFDSFSQAPPLPSRTHNSGVRERALACLPATRSLVDSPSQKPRQSRSVSATVDRSSASLTTIRTPLVCTYAT